MNYHIMIDEKFIDSLIEDAEAVCPPGTNRYLIRGDINERRFVTNPKAEWIPDISSPQFTDILGRITTIDKIIVHWYDLAIGRLMLTVDRATPVYAAVWGGEFSGDPLPFESRWLYDKQTWKYLRKTNTKPIVWSLDLISVARQYWQRLRKKKENKKLLHAKAETVKRIDAFLICPGSDMELMQIKKQHRLRSIQSMPFIFNQNFDLAKSIFQDKPKLSGSINIQVGNSCAASNNHIDCIKLLKGYNGNNMRLHVPLSYGPTSYAKMVKEVGESMFGNKFNALENFMGREQYINWLSDIDICIMYHNRSQAFGNCIALLTLGKKLYLKKENPLFGILNQAGIIIFDASLIGKVSFNEFCKPLTKNQIKSNQVILAGLFSTETRLNYLRKILN